MGLSAICGAIVTALVGAFNLGGVYQTNQAVLKDINQHISSLEKNYDALNIIVQDDRQSSQQIASLRSDILRLGQNLQEMARTIAELNAELSRVREANGRLDERVLLLDEIIKQLRKGSLR